MIVICTLPADAAGGGAGAGGVGAGAGEAVAGDDVVEGANGEGSVVVHAAPASAAAHAAIGNKDLIPFVDPIPVIVMDLPGAMSQFEMCNPHMAG